MTEVLTPDWIINQHEATNGDYVVEKDAFGCVLRYKNIKIMRHPVAAFLMDEVQPAHERGEISPTREEIEERLNV